MGVTTEQLDRLKAQSTVREQAGYFELVRAGDQRAASLWARLLAHDLNPSGKTSDIGVLLKPSGGANVDGYAEDAVCANADPNDLQNVVDCVNGAGQSGASWGASVKPRRPSDPWGRPQALSASDMAYLKSGGTPTPPQPPQVGFPYPDEGTAVKAYEQRVKKSYESVGRKFPDENDSSAFRHFSRYGYSCKSMPEPDAANKHIKELREELGAPPE